MKRNNKIAIISALTAFSMIGAAGSTIAWFSAILNIDMGGNVIGKSSGAYFASGTGTSEEPFIINNPVHLYNLAWLQYLGYFNNNSDALGATNGPTYFEIDENLNEPLDMTGWILPPIGTSTNPFIGSFEGNGKTIANLTTINSSNLEDYPKKPYPVRQDKVVSNVNVIGMFGIIGTNNLTMPSDSPSIKYPTDYPATGYEDNKVSNFYIDNGHVINYQSSTIAGIAAGYVNAPLSDIGITSSSGNNPSSIDLTNSSSAPTVFGGKTNISDFTSVGFCEDAYRTDVSKESIKIYEPITTHNTSGVTAEQTGQTAGWGGSVDMEEMYNRIETIQGNATTTYIPITNHYPNSDLDDVIDTTTGRVQYFHNDEIGSFTWYQYGENDFSGNFNYLGGGIQSADSYYNTEKRTGYLISSGNTYLSFNNTTFTTSNQTDAEYWILSNAPTNNGTATITRQVGTRTYYLNYNGFNTTSRTWTFESATNGYKLKYTANRTTYYLRLNNGALSRDTSQNNGTIFTFSTTQYDYIKGLDHTDYNYDYANGQFNTYFPLITNSDNTVAEKNTGYVISGSSFINGDYTFPIKSGDIRVSKYSTSDISNSYTTKTKTLSAVYTINASGNRETISSSNNFTKYDTSKTAFLNMISNGSIYGLHFMNGDISKDKVVTAPYALINGKEYTNYKLPADSIDFNIDKKGIINFFAGTYFSGNDSFFSLHSIQRDANNNITSIKEIAEILSNGVARDPYVYKYTDGTYSQANVSGYNTVLFKTSQIKKQQSLTSKAVYYFEIPVNGGEFALGSVSGGTGAYLMYLDIGTNATTIYRSTIVELIQSIAEEFSRPLGVGIVAGGTSVDDANSYCITIKSQYNGVVTVSRSDDTTATYTETNISDPDKVILSYAYDSLNVNGETAVANSRSEETTKRVTFYDYTPNDNSTTKTMISSIATTGSETPTYEIEQYKNYGTQNETEETENIVVFNDDGTINNTYQSATFFNKYTTPTVTKYQFVADCPGLGTITVTFVLTTFKSTTDNCDLYSPENYEITITLTNNSGTTDITSKCIFFAKDSNTYVVDATSGKLILVINTDFVLNDPSQTNP